MQNHVLILLDQHTCQYIHDELCPIWSIHLLMTHACHNGIDLLTTEQGTPTLELDECVWSIQYCGLFCLCLYVMSKDSKKVRKESKGKLSKKEKKPYVTRWLKLSETEDFLKWKFTGDIEPVLLQRYHSTPCLLQCSHVLNGITF